MATWAEEQDREGVTSWVFEYGSSRSGSIRIRLHRAAPNAMRDDRPIHFRADIWIGDRNSQQATACWTLQKETLDEAKDEAIGVVIHELRRISGALEHILGLPQGKRPRKKP